MSTSDKLRAIAGSDYEPILERPDVVWARARDLVVGVVEVEAATAQRKVEEAYNALDETNALRRSELWSVVLVVAIADGPTRDALAIARQIERDLRRSRKIAVVGNSPLPRLFDGIAGRHLPDAEPPRDVVTSVLDEVAHGELRQALDVLLKGKRQSEEVDRLIDLLGAEPTHG